MPEFVRVKLENGGHATVPAAFAKDHDLTALDKPATDDRGKPLAPKPPADLEQVAEGYDALTVPQLKAAIDQRNAVLAEDAQIPTGGNKADLVAALEANDDASEEDQ